RIHEPRRIPRAPSVGREPLCSWCSSWPNLPRRASPTAASEMNDSMMPAAPSTPRGLWAPDALLAAIRARTPARLLVGRAGGGYRTATYLELRRDHAAAMDAVAAE